MKKKWRMKKNLDLTSNPPAIYGPAHHKNTTSVIVVTCKRPWTMVKRSLKSILDQTHPVTEAILVDSNPQSFEKECSQLGVKNIHIEERGKAKAVNAAIKASRGDVLFFIDDDAIASPTWVDKHMETYNANGKVGVVCGRTIAHAESDSEFETNYGHDRGTEYKKYTGKDLSVALLVKTVAKAFKKGSARYRLLIPGGIGIGNNMSIRREIFETLGLFNENYGPNSYFLSGDEVEMFMRVLCRSLWEIAYNPSAIVRHDHSTKKLESVMYRNYTCTSAVLLHYPSFYSILNLLGRFFELAVNHNKVINYRQQLLGLINGIKLSLKQWLKRS
jgi:glycosyltransferase involved in cell wall biosynthesis